MKYKLSVNIIFILVLIAAPLINAEEFTGFLNKEYPNDVYVELRTPHIIRGNGSLEIVQIFNLKKNSDLTIENIRILNIRNETIEERFIGATIKPVGKYVNQINHMINVPFLRHLQLAHGSLLLKLVEKTKEGDYKSEGFRGDISDFSKIAKS